MKLAVLVCLASSVIATIFVDPQLDAKWEKHKESNRKLYSPEEDAIRKKYFAATDRYIERQNRFPRSFVADHNRFSDMSAEEKQQYLGLQGDRRKFPRRTWSFELNRNRTFGNFVVSGPDYRSDSCLQPVRDQGSCGSCWAFTAITPLEFSQCKLTGTPVALSEQHLLDCDPVNGGCNGGWYDTAWKFLKGGSMLDSKYGPYQAMEETCNADKTHVGAEVLSYEWIEASPQAMVEALEDGPIAVAMMVVNSFYSYKSGVYIGFNCRTSVNHAVVIVGYGTSGGIPYWIMRNSWGTDWGDAGYMLVARGVNMCNIELYAAKVKAKGNVNKI